MSNRDKFDEWKRKRTQNSVSKEEALRIIRSQAIEPSEPFRLEVLLDTDGTLVLIQGNLRGLTSLKGILDRLINTNAIGGHAHLDYLHPLTKANVSLIIQLVDDEAGEGPHSVS